MSPLIRIVTHLLNPVLSFSYYKTADTLRDCWGTDSCHFTNDWLHYNRLLDCCPVRTWAKVIFLLPLHVNRSPGQKCHAALLYCQLNCTLISLTCTWPFAPQLCVLSRPESWPQPFSLLHRYCGERSPFVVSSNSSKIMVKFHSDASNTDTGFTAQYLSYEPKNREYTEVFTYKD